ncbi:MAG: hypothetical protein ACTSQO_07290 [Candidatus Helarchaeota archaeon]
MASELLINNNTNIICNKECDNFQCFLSEHFKSLMSRDYINETLGYASKEIYKLALENTTPIKRKKNLVKVKELLKEINRSEFLYKKGNNKILITAPHATWHYRYTWGKNRKKLGDWIKYDDVNTGLIACYLSRYLDCHALIQIYTAWLDPNFYREALFQEKMRSILKKEKIKFVLDVHGLSSDREADFDIIDLFGMALVPFNALKFRKSLKKRLEQFGYEVGVNRYFNGGLTLPFQHTIVKEVSQEFQIPCIELEINKKFRNIPGEIIDKKVLNVLFNWLKSDVNKDLR